MATDGANKKLKTDNNADAGVRAVMSGDTFGGTVIEGISIAGQETCVILPQYGVVFDTGRCPQKACYQQKVLISHGHLDHIGGLPFIIATRGMQKLPPADIYVPKEIVPAAKELINAVSNLTLDSCDLPDCIRPSQPGSEICIKPHLIAKPFRTCHTIISQGYLVMLEKKKLKQQYLGLPGKEIKRLKDEGTEIQDTVRSPELAFTGDTTIAFLEDVLVDEILSAKLLIMEITTLDRLLSPQETEERGHTHLEHVLQNADRFKNAAILFIHISPRYSRQDALDILNQRLPDDLKSRCGVLLEGFK